jgi:aspartyl/asparaginyl-tRNA synthetase
MKASPTIKMFSNSSIQGLSVEVSGTLVQSPGKGQNIELKAATVQVYGTSDPETYPLQKKRHSFEFLRTIGHLRSRTNTLGAVMRVRNACATAIHNFFQEREKHGVYAVGCHDQHQDNDDELVPY